MEDDARGREGGGVVAFVGGSERVGGSQGEACATYAFSVFVKDEEWD